MVTPSGLEQYAIRAREISAQVMDDTHRKTFLRCEPASPKAFDEPCARQFLGTSGRKLLRRPLTDNEMTAVVKEARHAAETSRSFYKGVQSGLGALLMAPSFIFRMETTEADPDHTGALRLDAYSLGLTLQQAMGMPVGSWGTGANATSKPVVDVLA